MLVLHGNQVVKPLFSLGMSFSGYVDPLAKPWREAWPLSDDASFHRRHQHADVREPSLSEIVSDT